VSKNGLGRGDTRHSKTLYENENKGKIGGSENHKEGKKFR